MQPPGTGAPGRPATWVTETQLLEPSSPPRVRIAKYVELEAKPRNQTHSYVRPGSLHQHLNQ